jgi:membrane-bound lytic murein transglycosylase B
VRVAAIVIAIIVADVKVCTTTVLKRGGATASAEVVQALRLADVVQALRPADVVQAFRPADVVQAFRPADVVQAFRPADVVQAFRPADVAQAFRPADVVQAFRPADVAQAFRPADVVQAFRPADGQQTPSPPEQDTRPSFSEFLAGLRVDAISRGIREETVDQALATVEEPLPVVLERDRTQAEVVLSLEEYVSRRLTPKFMRTAREMYQRQRRLLNDVGEKYGVPPRIIASNFGRFSGVRPTIPALATLAWDPRRSTFFRGELFKALEILDRGDIDLARMRGSWAGAMGQVQFMPSSYVDFAEDFDGDGRRDIWSTPADVFASIANYLKGHGWTAGQTWGREVAVTPEVERTITNDIERRNGSCPAMRLMTVALPVERWKELGVRLPNGKPLPASMPEAALVSGTNQHYLVYANYDALLEYNCAHSYAVTVGVLADRLAAPSARPAAKKRIARRH